MKRGHLCLAALTLLLLLPREGRAERDALDVYAAAEAAGGQSGDYLRAVMLVSRSPKQNKVRGYDVTELRRLAYSMALRYNISPRLFTAIISHESNFDPYCRGAAGEYSLGQILPSTWELMRRSGKVSGSPWLPENNLEAAAIYIRDSYASLTRQDLAYAARMGYQREHLILCLYNGGRGTLDQYVNVSKPLSPKLISYVKNVVKIYNSLGRREKRK